MEALERKLVIPVSGFVKGLGCKLLVRTTFEPLTMMASSRSIASSFCDADMIDEGDIPMKTSTRSCSDEPEVVETQAVQTHAVETLPKPTTRFQPTRLQQEARNRRRQRLLKIEDQATEEPAVVTPREARPIRLKQRVESEASVASGWESAEKEWTGLVSPPHVSSTSYVKQQPESTPVYNVPPNPSNYGRVQSIHGQVVPAVVEDEEESNSDEETNSDEDSTSDEDTTCDEESTTEDSLLMTDEETLDQPTKRYSYQFDDPHAESLLPRRRVHTRRQIRQHSRGSIESISEDESSIEVDQKGHVDVVEKESLVEDYQKGHSLDDESSMEEYRKSLMKNQKGHQLDDESSMEEYPKSSLKEYSKSSIKDYSKSSTEDYSKSRHERIEDESSVEYPKLRRRGSGNSTSSLLRRHKDPRAPRKSVTFDSEGITLHEYDDTTVGEDTVGEDTVGEDTLASSVFSRDEYSLGSQTLNSEYTKSYESEVEDIVKDFLMIGSGRGSHPGKRARKYQPGIKSMLKSKKKDVSDKPIKSTDIRAGKKEDPKRVANKSETLITETEPSETNAYTLKTVSSESSRTSRASLRSQVDDSRASTWRSARSEDLESKTFERTARSDLSDGRNSHSSAKSDTSEGRTSRSSSRPSRNEIRPSRAESLDSRASSIARRERSLELRGSRRGDDDEASRVASLANSAYTFGEDVHESESLVSGLTYDKSAKKLGGDEPEIQGDVNMVDGSTKTDACGMASFSQFLDTVGSACGFSYPPAEVSIQEKNGSTVNTNTAPTTQQEPSSSTEDLLQQVQNQIYVMGIQVQEWLESTAGCNVELVAKKEKPDSELVLEEQPNNSAPVESVVSSANTKETDPAAEEQLVKGLLAAVNAAAITLHEQHGEVFDNSYDIDVSSDVKFVVVTASLPLGVLFKENIGGCFVSRVFQSAHQAMVATEEGETVQVGDQLTAIDGKSAIFKTVPQVCSMMSTCDDTQHIEITFLRYIGDLHPMSQDEDHRRDEMSPNSDLSDAESTGSHFWSKVPEKPVDLMELSRVRKEEIMAKRIERAVCTKRPILETPSPVTDEQQVEPRVESEAPAKVTAPKKRNPFKKLFGKKK